MRDSWYAPRGQTLEMERMLIQVSFSARRLAWDGLLPECEVDTGGRASLVSECGGAAAPAFVVLGSLRKITMIFVHRCAAAPGAFLRRLYLASFRVCGIDAGGRASLVSMRGRCCPILRCHLVLFSA